MVLLEVPHGQGEQQCDAAKHRCAAGDSRTFVGGPQEPTTRWNGENFQPCISEFWISHSISTPELKHRKYLSVGPVAWKSILIPKRCSPKPRGCAGRPSTRARWRRHRGQAGSIAQACSRNHEPQAHNRAGRGIEPGIGSCSTSTSGRSPTNDSTAHNASGGKN